MAFGLPVVVLKLDAFSATFTHAYARIYHNTSINCQRNQSHPPDSIDVSSSYGVSDWHEDLKKILLQVCLTGWLTECDTPSCLTHAPCITQCSVCGFTP